MYKSLSRTGTGMEVDMREAHESEGLQVDSSHDGHATPSTAGGYVPPPYAQKSDWSNLPDSPPRDTRKRTILGLGVGVFWILVLVVAVIIAAGLGTGIGIGLSSQKASNTKATATTCPTSTISSTTPSSSASTTATAVQGLASPSIDTPCYSTSSSSRVWSSDLSILSTNSVTGQTISGQVYTLHCNTHFPATAQFNNPNVTDIYTTWAEDLMACVNACAYYNTGKAVTTQGADKCVVATVANMLAGSGGSFGNSCILKSATGINDTTTDYFPEYRFDSAILNS